MEVAVAIMNCGPILVPLRKATSANNPHYYYYHFTIQAYLNSNSPSHQITQKRTLVPFLHFKTFCTLLLLSHFFCDHCYTYFICKIKVVIFLETLFPCHDPFIIMILLWDSSLSWTKWFWFLRASYHILRSSYHWSPIAKKPTNNLSTEIWLLILMRKLFWNLGF